MKVVLIKGIPLINGSKPVWCKGEHGTKEQAVILFEVGKVILPLCEACLQDLMALALEKY